jgi:hypothetical protein
MAPPSSATRFDRWKALYQECTKNCTNEFVFGRAAEKLYDTDPIPSWPIADLFLQKADAYSTRWTATLLNLRLVDHQSVLRALLKHCPRFGNVSHQATASVERIADDPDTATHSAHQKSCMHNVAMLKMLYTSVAGPHRLWNSKEAVEFVKELTELTREWGSTESPPAGTSNDDISRDAARLELEEAFPEGVRATRLAVANLLQAFFMKTFGNESNPPFTDSE